MSLNSWLYAVEALMVEENLRFHVETDDSPEPRGAPAPADTRARNAQSMEAFTALMGGIQKGRGRRR